jgi:two-component system, LytTR family, response regulator
MIQAIIIDDEQHCIHRLTELLAKHHAHEIELMATFSTVEEGLKAMELLKPRLLFLDVQIHDKTGFDLLKKLGRADFDVIFTTAYEKFAVQAFKFSALDYLLKPVDADDLAAALAKFREKVTKNETAARLDILFHNLKAIQGGTKKICVPVAAGFTFLEVAEIVRCESEINYTTIYLRDKKKLMVAKTLKEFEEMLSEYNFFRVHNSHLINLAYIKSYNRGKGGFVTLADNSHVEVSTRRKDDFMKAIERNF